MEQDQQPRYAGHYVLKPNCFHFDPDTGEKHHPGDVVYLTRHEAERLHQVFIPLDSHEAKRLQATTPEAKRQLRREELEAELAALEAEEDAAEKAESA